MEPLKHVLQPWRQFSMGCIPSAMVATGAHAVKSWRPQTLSVLIYFTFILWSQLSISVFYITFSIMFSGLTTADVKPENIIEKENCKFKWNMIVLKVLPSLVKYAFICKLSSCFNQNCFIKKRCECNTGSIMFLWNSQKIQKAACCRMGLDKGKMRGCIQSSIFWVCPMSRCREQTCTPTATVGFHKESVSIQLLIHAAEGAGIVTLHAKFQLVLVPVVSVKKGMGYISEMATSGPHSATMLLKLKARIRGWNYTVWRQQYNKITGRSNS